MRFMPLEIYPPSSRMSSSTESICSKSMPPVAMSSGGLVGTPAAETADVKEPVPEKNSQKRYLEESRASYQSRSSSGKMSPSRRLSESSSKGSPRGALRSAEGPHSSAARAPPQRLEAPLAPLDDAPLSPLSLPPLPFLSPLPLP